MAGAINVVHYIIILHTWLHWPRHKINLSTHKRQPISYPTGELRGVCCETWDKINQVITASHGTHYPSHYCDVIMGTIASQITSLVVVYSTLYSGPDQRQHQGSVSLAFVRGIHRWPVNCPHKGPVTRKMFPFNDVIMLALLVYKWANIGPPEFCSDIYMRHLCYMDTSKSYPTGTFKNNWNNFLCEFENQSLTWY